LARERRLKPAPCPPAVRRPVEYSITEIAALIADPYAIYAKKILKIRELSPLDEESDANLFGTIVHKGLADYFAAKPDTGAADAPARLAAALLAAMGAYRPRAALNQWWAARLERIADWIIATERTRETPAARALEVPGRWELGGFTVKGVADRIERRADGGITILDYKTTTPPAAKAVEAGTAPQLPLEAVMAAEGCFGADFIGPVTELAYWRLMGRQAAGQLAPLFKRKPQVLGDVIAAARDKTPLLLAKFALGETPYLAKPHPSRSTYHDTYGGISRRAEWGGEEEGEDEE
jgi:ATP-dependent helicase/nuclease subunit B